MADILGPRAVLDIAMPTGIDSTYITNEMLKVGMTAEELIALAANRIGMVNQQFMADYGRVTYLTDSFWSRYRQGKGARRMTPLRSEFTMPDGQRSKMIGHMLPIAPYTDAIEWSMEYLRDADPDQIRFDLDEISDSWRDRLEYQFWTRVLTTTENAVGDGGTGFDVPWVHSTSGSVDYTPPPFGSTVFASTHDHFVYLDDDNYSWADIISAQMAHLVEHGIVGPFELFVPYADIAEFSVLDGFVVLKPPEIQMTGSGSDNPRDPMYTTDGVPSGVPGTLMGYYFSELYGLARIWHHSRIPTDYAWMTKSYGNNNPSNGVAIRVRSDTGFGLTIDPQLSKSINPTIETLLFKADVGFGTNDRLNGVAAFLNATAPSYTAPTIS